MPVCSEPFMQVQRCAASILPGDGTWQNHHHTDDLAPRQILLHLPAHTRAGTESFFSCSCYLCTAHGPWLL